jgi:hypothetical protein
MRFIRRATGRRSEGPASDYLAKRPAVLAVPKKLREQILAWGRTVKPVQITEDDLWRDLPLLAAWIEAKRVRLQARPYGKTILQATGWLTTEGRFTAAWYDYFLKDRWPKYLEAKDGVEVDPEGGGQFEATRPFTGTGLFWIGYESKTGTLHTCIKEHRMAVLTTFGTRTAGTRDGLASVVAHRPPYVYFKGGAPLWLVDVQPAVDRKKPEDIGNFALATSVEWLNLSFEESYNPNEDPVFLATVGPIRAAMRRKRMRDTRW